METGGVGCVSQDADRHRLPSLPGGRSQCLRQRLPGSAMQISPDDKEEAERDRPPVSEKPKVIFTNKILDDASRKSALKKKWKL